MEPKKTGINVMSDRVNTMPASLFAARCLYVAQQPLQYRRDVIRRMYTARVATHSAMIAGVGLPLALKSFDAKYRVPWTGTTLQKQFFRAVNPF